jgi:hypothetical protein|uniref:Uncharacterized protein n=1 Tax=Zea mays TaxID=4577 RepID=A0A804NP39_MAIZE
MRTQLTETEEVHNNLMRQQCNLRLVATNVCRDARVASYLMNRILVLKHAEMLRKLYKFNRAVFYFSWFMCAQICSDVLPFLCPAPARWKQCRCIRTKYRLGEKKNQSKIGEYENDLAGLR